LTQIAIETTAIPQPRFTREICQHGARKPNHHQIEQHAFGPLTGHLKCNPCERVVLSGLADALQEKYDGKSTG
jgi:hypothetical protein